MKKIISVFLSTILFLIGSIPVFATEVGISMIVGGVGLGSVQTYIKSEGKRSKKIFTKTIKLKLIAWGAGKFAVSLGVAVEYILNYANYGDKMAEWLDSKEDILNNGYLDVIL